MRNLSILIGLLALIATPTVAQQSVKIIGGAGGTATVTGGKLDVNATISSGGSTQDVNLAQVAGATVATGHGTASGAVRVELPTDGTGIIAGVTTLTGGGVAHDSPDSGNPIKTGCVANSSAPTAVTAADRANTWCFLNGQQAVSIVSSTTGTAVPLASVSADGQSVQAGLFINNQQVLFNGTNYDRLFTCGSQAAISVTAGNTTQIVALSGSTIIRVCSFAISMSLAGTAQFVYGTGSNCGTGTTNITAAMNLATATPMTLSGGNSSVMRTAAANALCVAAVTGNVTGYLTYAQF